jgi:hypothetical protein
MEAGGEFGGDANFPTRTCEGCGARWARALWQLEGGRRVRRGASVVLEGPAGGSKIARSLGGSYDTGMEAAARAVAGQGGRWSSAGGGFGSCGSRAQGPPSDGGSKIARQQVSNGAMAVCDGERGRRRGGQACALGAQRRATGATRAARWHGRC